MKRLISTILFLTFISTALFAQIVIDPGSGGTEYVAPLAAEAATRLASDEANLITATNYADSVAAGNSLLVYFDESASDIASYEAFTLSPIVASSSDAVVPLASTALQPFDNWMTPAGYPNLQTLRAGVYVMKMYVLKAGSGNAVMKAELYTYTVGGVLTFVATSSRAVVTANTFGDGVNLDFAVASPTNIATSTRYAVKVYAARESAQSCSLQMYYGDGNQGYMTIPITSQVYMRADGSNASSSYISLGRVDATIFNATTSYQLNGATVLMGDPSKFNVFAGGAGNSDVTGQYNFGGGAYSLQALLGGSANLGIGYCALTNLVNGSYNVGIGFSAGRYITDGASLNATPSNSIFIGNDTRARDNSQTNQIVIGDSAIGAGNNSVVLGSDSIVATLLKGEVLIATSTDAGDYKLQVDGNLNLTAGNKFSIGGVEFTGGSSGGGMASYTTIASYSATYTVTINDVNQLIKMNTASTTTNLVQSIIIPPAASVTWVLGSTINFVRYGVGEVRIVGTGGVTINSVATSTVSASTGNAWLLQQFSAASLLYIGTDTFLLTGHLKEGF